MLTFDANGIYCKQADVYIDPWKPVSKAIITHGHSDHARFGMGSYLTQKLTEPILRYRLGADINCQTLEYSEPITMNGVKISLHPAGHIWGSAQVRLEYNGEVWVVSGDYKVKDDGLSGVFEPVKCHSFVTESTFGMPIYNFPDQLIVKEEINDWWRKNKDEGKNSVLLAYSLGKAQRVTQLVDDGIGPIYTHGAVDNVNQLYLSIGGKLHRTQRITPETDRKKITGAMIVAPPSAADSPWLRSFQPYSLGVCSGWMQLRGTRRRRGADRGFVLSDHADWQQLNEAVLATGAENVYVTHGYKSVFARWLAANQALNAHEVETLYTGEGNDEAAETSNEEKA